MDVAVNASMKLLDKNHLVKTYCSKATYLGNVGENASVYIETPPEVDGDEDDLPLATLVEPVADADVPLDVVLVFGHHPESVKDERSGRRGLGGESSPVGLPRGEGVLEGGV